MPGLVPGIHVFKSIKQEGVDGRDKPGHDGQILGLNPQQLLRVAAGQRRAG